MHNKKKRRKLLLTALSVSLYSSLIGQNVSSPYSVLGVGDIDSRDYSRYHFSGHSGVSRQNSAAYNQANPASLSSLFYKSIHLDISMRGRNSVFKMPDQDTTLDPTKDFAVKRLSVAFKPGKKTGVAFGLQPYSSVNYQFMQNKVILDGTTPYYKTVEGSGGIHQFFVSTGTSLTKKLSAGVTASWLFGSLQRTSTFGSSVIDLSVTREERDYYNAVKLLAGLQYVSKGKKWEHQLGITSSIISNPAGQSTTTIYDGTTEAVKEITENSKYMLPFSTSFGYSATYNDRFTLNGNAEYNHWNKQKLDYPDSYTGDAIRLSAGIEIALNSRKWPGKNERPYFGISINADKSYMRIQGKELWDYYATIGGGLTLTRNLVAWGGLEWGLKGRTSLNQIKEHYTQYILGFSIKDIWFATRKFGRYN